MQRRSKLNNRPLFVSYFTENTLYEKESADLIASFKKFGLEYEVAAVPNLGSWSKNCCYKPAFLLEMLEKHNRPLVWTDVDSVVVKDPVFFDECYADIALRINDQLSTDDKAKVLTGTFFINNTPSAKKLLQLWKKECERILEKDAMAFDQVALRKVILHYPTIVEIKRLPTSYITIVDNPKDLEEVGDGAVIVHYQASRLNQKIMDNEVVEALANGMSSDELKKIRTE